MTSYLAAIGSIRVFETRLFSEAEKEKMLGATSFEEAFNMLNDLDFAPFLSDVQKAEDFERVLQSGLYAVKQEITRLSSHAEEINVLWLQYDLHNTKVLFKSEASEEMKEVDDLLLPYGSRSIERMKSIVEGGTTQEKDVWIHKALESAREAYKNSKNMLLAEYELDTAFFHKALQIAQKSKSKFLIDFVRARIDEQNILTSFRALVRNQDASHVSFLEGGSVSEASLTAEDMDHFGLHLPFLWKEAAQAGKQDFEKTGNMTKLENSLSEVTMRILEDAKFVIDGPEPLIAFFWRKYHNAHILRTLLVGKRAGFSEENIRHALPKVF